MSNYFDEWVGQQLKVYRLQNKLTLEEVGQRIGKTKKQVQNYEVGKTRLFLPLLIELCELYGVDYRRFIEEAIKQLEVEHK
jgi:transcriptional regulator with XRE-family HTH domain